MWGRRNISSGTFSDPGICRMQCGFGQDTSEVNAIFLHARSKQTDQQRLCKSLKLVTHFELRVDCPSIEKKWRTALSSLRWVVPEQTLQGAVRASAPSAFPIAHAPLCPACIFRHREVGKTKIKKMQRNNEHVSQPSQTVLANTIRGALL